MSTEQNKTVVRRFLTEVIAGGNIKAVDELLAPNYANRAMATDLAGFKAMLPGLRAALPDVRIEIESLVAEGDAVVARYTMTGAKISARGLTYYALANGRIVEDEPMTTPDLRQVLGM